MLSGLVCFYGAVVIQHLTIQTGMRALWLQKPPTAKLGLLIIALLLALGSKAFATPEPEASLVYTQAEKLVYRVSWSGIVGAYTTMETIPGRNYQGQRATLFVSRTHTTSFIDTFFQVNDYLFAYVTEQQEPLFYQKNLREGLYSDSKRISFDSAKGLAYCVSGAGSSKRNYRFEIENGTLDPLSAMYFLRTLDLGSYKQIRVTICDGQKVLPLTIDVNGSEQVTVPLGSYDTIKITPQISKISGIFKHEGRLSIWLAPALKNIPVLIKSRVLIGSFSAELIAINPEERP